MAGRRNDPLGLAMSQSPTSDPTTVVAVQAEVRRRVAYLELDYRFARSLGLNKTDFNAEVTAFKAASLKPAQSDRSARHAWIEYGIFHRARTLAGIPDGQPLLPRHEDFVAQATRELARELKVISGPRGRGDLVRYVEGAMAIWQDASGKPLEAPRDKGNDYSPYLKGVGGEFLRTVIDRLVPGIADRTLAQWVRDARRKYAGKSMLFAELFPGYSIAEGVRSGRLKIEAHGPEGFELTVPTK